MKSDTRIFVSYTRRDGQVTTPLLKRFGENLDEVCIPFIHSIHSCKSRWEQFQVIKKLVRSHTLLLIESRRVYKSPWVAIEIFLAKLLLIPVVRIPVENLIGLTEKGDDLAAGI